MNADDVSRHFNAFGYDPGPGPGLKTSSNCWEYLNDYWTRDVLPAELILTCLLPNNVILPLYVPVTYSVYEIKIELWEESKKHVHCELDELVFYGAEYLNFAGTRVVVEDETRLVYDLRPLGGVFRFQKRSLVSNDRFRNLMDSLIGDKVRHFEASIDNELFDFRVKTRYVSVTYAYHRSCMCRHELIHYQYPARLATTSDIPCLLKSRLEAPNQQCVPIVVKVEYIGEKKIDSAQSSFMFRLVPERPARQAIQTILDKCCSVFKKRGCVVDDFILKVSGRNEYIFGEEPLIQFMYIQETLINNNIPVVTLKNIKEVKVYTDSVQDIQIPQAPPRPPKPNKKILPLTKPYKSRLIDSHVVDMNYRCTVGQLTVPRIDVSTVAVHTAVFYGTQLLCEPRSSENKPVVTKAMCSLIDVDETFIFDIHVCNLPLGAKICFVVSEGYKNSSTKKKSSEVLNSLFWINVTAFDYKNKLRSSSVTLRMWNYTSTEARNNSFWVTIGTTMENTFATDAMVMELSFYNYHYDFSIMYPSPMFINMYVEEFGRPSVSVTNNGAEDGPNIEQMRTYLYQYSNFSNLPEKIQNKIWRLRFILRRYFPAKLYRLIEVVKWNDYRDVWELLSMLEDWPKLEFDQALGLLGHQHSDPMLRAFAVACLQLTDDEVILYFMQLVQALRAEHFLHNNLCSFLLERAFMNQLIGHYLYWHLRSMISMPTLSAQFGLILEAYFLGSQHHMEELKHQLLAIDTMRLCSEACRSKKDRDKARQEMISFLTKPHIASIFSNLTCPLDPAYRCTRILVEKCRVMVSKMRPLWIVFENADKYGDNINVIFKVGDDLRQDMLALQIIKIMDNIWKSNGYEYRMSPYQCIATDYREGLIGVVTESDTVANIQKAKSTFTATSAWHQDSLYLWLADYNPKKDQLFQAVEEFTVSCAGYSVATFVLGIADRHSDNILLRQNGQLFHIDFGHILGNFKEKFGIRRERTPFVLTNDFVFVMNHHHDEDKTSGFERFQNLCDRGFLLVRKHGSLIISLFSMMKMAGLPELSSDEDLKFLQETFCLNSAEKDALRHFREQFTESLMNAWKTSINWTTHNLSKNNN